MGADSVRHASLWSSFIHAVVVLILGPCAMGYQVYAAYEVFNSSIVLKDGDSGFAVFIQQFVEFFQFFLANLQHTDPTPLMKFICGFAGVYYVIDLIIMSVEQTTRVE